MPVWARLVTAVAALRVAATLTLYLSGLFNVSFQAPVPVEAYAALSFSFGALGVVLVIANGNDVRAGWLGGVLLLLAVPLSNRFVLQSPYAAGQLLARVNIDAFLPAFLWFFVAEFPSALMSRARRAAWFCATAAGLYGAAAFAVNLSIFVWPADQSGLGWRALLATGRSPGSLYWLAVFLLSAVAFVALLGRMVRSAGEDRLRVRIFIGGLVVGILPLVLEVVVEESWQFWRQLAHRPAVEPWVALVLFGAMATTPFVTAYSVLFDRVVHLRLVLRAAVQYLLARYTILALTSLPFVALALYLGQHRTEPLIALLSGPRPLILILAVFCGVLALRARRRLLSAIDRRFFREQYDAELLLTSVMTDQLVSQSLPEIAESLAAEIDRTIHARADLFIVDDTVAALRDPRGQRPALEANATLVTLAMADVLPMDLLLGTGSALDRLPASEKRWIEHGGYRLVVALRTRSGAPAGLLALGAKRSELAFSGADRRALNALAPLIALAIENHRLRHTPEPPTEFAARECMKCSRLHGPGVLQCPCGGGLTDAQAPHLLRGVFKFEQRIGSGGMGVVYRAVDVTLGREVAIKTLPKVTPDHATRLRREAQAMASMVHTNLAVIYGIETWRGTPFLVEEYLAGGTLLDRLRAGPMTIDDALDLGTSITTVLGQLHAAGIVHCDIKPSNIGFSQNGVVKLLDFGLAHLLRDSSEAVATTITVWKQKPQAMSLVLTDRGLLGTPPYMSPEAIHAAQPAPSFDLWALSVVLYEAVVGRRPFSGIDARDVFDNIGRGVFPHANALRADCPPKLSRFFDRALALDIALRPRDAGAFGADLFVLRSSSA